VGGAERQLFETIRHLDQTRFSNIVHYSHPPDDLRVDFESLHVPTIRLSSTNKVGWFALIRGLTQAVRDYDVDLIHGSVFPSDVFALIAGVFTRVPVVITITNTFDMKSRAQANRNSRGKHWRSHVVHRFGYSVGAIAARISKCAIVAISEAVKHSASRDLHLPHQLMEVIYRGVIPEEFDHTGPSIGRLPEVKKKLGLYDCYPILLNGARLVPQKGQDDLVRAMPAIVARYPNARLLIAGRGHLYAKLQDLRDRLSLQNHVHIMGKQDVVPLLHMCDISVFSSHYEGLGNSVVEAQAAGKLVVAFHIPSLEEIVENGRSGILVDSRDVQRFAQAVTELASKPTLMRAMGERGRQIVRRKFDIRKNVRKLESLYERILQSNSGGLFHA